MSIRARRRPWGAAYVVLVMLCAYASYQAGQYYATHLSDSDLYSEQGKGVMQSITCFPVDDGADCGFIWWKSRRDCEIARAAIKKLVARLEEHASGPPITVACTDKKEVEYENVPQGDGI